MRHGVVACATSLPSASKTSPRAVAARCQRRSPMLQHRVEMAGVLFAGRGGARLLRIVKAPLSRTGVRFQLMRTRLPSAVTRTRLTTVGRTVRSPCFSCAPHAKRLFAAVHAVSGTGRSLSAIARELGLNRRTVAKYAHADSWQECVRSTPPRRFTSLDPYLEYLRRRWEEGEHTATLLHQAIRPSHAQRCAGVMTGERNHAFWPVPVQPRTTTRQVHLFGIRMANILQLSCDVRLLRLRLSAGTEER
ncbi:hypothetical protein [Streptomyces sp. NPDC127119]|uniref:terminase gpP N-terminus-related DNA-binding protein n=1 Tax=Streptomyces sp. NPDC127119 TaxID=3345370 RepID=UPI00362572A1